MKRSKIYLRDIGGIPLQDGKGVTPYGLFLRSGKLSTLTAEKCKALCEQYHIACVIDLRTPIESQEFPDPLPDGVEYIRISLLKDATVGITHEIGSDPMTIIRNLRKNPGKLKEMVPNFKEMYIRVVSDEYSRPQLDKAVATLRKNAAEGKCTLFHCTAGKDRTGLLSMALLKSYGVSDEDITKLTNNIEKVLEAKKNYIKEIEPMNNIINKLVEYGLNEEKLLNEEFSNILKMFLDKLNECLEGQKKKYEGQSSVLADLYAKIKSEKIENLKSGIQEYRLHCLSVYINIKNIARNKGNNSQEIVLNQKSKDFEIYKNITLENIENIIKEMKKNGLEIRAKDLEDLEKEKVKDFIEKKSKLVSEKTDENFSKEDKDKLIEYFKEDEEYRSLFLQILNNDRAKGGEIFNKNIFLYMGEIFENINDLVLEKNDYRFFKYVSIISMTYFITEKNKKRYLFEFIKDNNKLKFMDFWKKYSKFVVELDMENDITKKELITEQSTKTKYKFAAFSNTLTIVNNMVNFGFDKNFIHEFINFAENNYSLSKEQIGQIEDLMVVWSSNTDTSNNKSDDNDNNKETNKDEVDSNDKDKYEDMK